MSCKLVRPFEFTNRKVYCIYVDASSQAGLQSKNLRIQIKKKLSVNLLFSQAALPILSCNCSSANILDTIRCCTNYY